jgi:tRNA nucleotidyltransferase (CCA-adding enzyme)
VSGRPWQAPKVLRAVARAVRDAGGQAFAVGGSVRDHLLDAEVSDWDVEVFGLAADDLQTLLQAFGKVDLVGRAFGVLKLTAGGRVYDISIPRRDSKVGRGHRGIQVAGDPTLPIAEAARRRDLTVNALLADLETGAIVDPWGGLDDLAAGRLRAVDPETFLEDPLRALRVAQFAARLGFSVDPALTALCRRADLADLPAERIQGEWAKLLLRGHQPSVGLSFARDADILARVFPMLADDPEAGARLDRLVPTRTALAPEGRQWALMLTGWLALQSSPAVMDTLDRLWLHQWKGYPLRDTVLAATAHWADPCHSDADLRWLASRCEAGIALAVREAIRQDTGEARARAADLGCHERPPAPLLQGRDLAALGFSPGPAMGTVLRTVYAAQLDGTITSAAAARDYAAGLR